MRTKQFAVITTSLASAASASFDVSLHLIENLINNSAIYRKCAFTCADDECHAQDLIHFGMYVYSNNQRIIINRILNWRRVAAVFFCCCWNFCSGNKFQSICTSKETFAYSKKRIYKLT
jgi:hypothetical protein